MLGKLFPNTFGGNDSNGKGQLTTGANYGLQGYEKRDFVDAVNLPVDATIDDVKETATIRGELEAQTPILKRLSEEKQGLADAALANLDIRVQHAGVMLQKEDRYQKAIAKHGKNYLAQTVNTVANQANFTGYEAEFQAAGDVIDI